MREFLLFLIVVVLGAIAYLLWEHNRTYYILQPYQNVPASHEARKPRAPERVPPQTVDSALQTADSAKAARTAELKKIRHTPEGCAGRPTAKHDDIWDNW